MTVPYTFANQTGNIPLAQLDANFANVGGYANTSGTVTANAQPNITTVGTMAYLTATGNITGAYFIGNGSQLTGIVANSSYSNANVQSYLPTYTGNLAGGNVITTGRIQALGNVSGNFFVGNGSQLTGITGNYSNTNVASYLTTYTGNITGNTVTANFFIGDGSGLTNLPVDNYGNSNVAAYLPTYTGNLAGGNVTITANTQSGNLLTGGVVSAVGNVRGSNLNTVGNVSASGNIIGAFLYGDGSNISNLPAGNYGNANVEAYLPTSNTIININSNVSNTNSNVANLTNSLANNISSNTITITGTANLGNLTITDQTISGINSNQDIVFDPAGTGNVNVNGPLQVFSGNLTADPIFQVNIDGRVKALIPNVSSYDGAFNIVGSTNGIEVSPQNLGVMLHTTGQPSTPARIYNDASANYAAIINRRYNGTAAAPTGVLAGEIMGRLGATPYLDNGGAGEWPAISTTRLDFTATEIQTPNAQGSKIQMYTVSNGNTTPTLTAEFDIDTGIKLTGNIVPTTDGVYELGNATNRWANLWLGPTSLNMQDTVTLTNTELTVTNGVLLIDGVQKVQVGNMQMTTDGISLVTANTGSNIQVGTVGDTGYMQVNMPGIKFASGNIQLDAAVTTNQLAVANGVATLNPSGIVWANQLPAGAITFLGTWDAANNTPSLADGVGTAGDEYIVNVAGVQNLGSGNITFNVGDLVLYNTSNVWVDIPASSPGVTSFNGNTGVVTLSQADVLSALGNGSITNNNLANSSITVNTGAGISLTGNTTVELGDSITLTNTGILNILSGTGVTASTTLGNTTISIGQPVGTANSVQFAGINSTTTIQATGNITGGNIATAGRVVATGNVVGGNISAVANVTTANLTVTGISNLNSNANVKISGGIPGQSLITDGTGNLSWASPTAGNTITVNGAVTSNAAIDFTYNSTTLIYQPTANVNITLANYVAGHTARVLVRFNSSVYPINTGIANAAQSTEGTITIPTSGGGGHNLSPNSTCQLLYTCFDNTAANCYVAATFL